MKSRHQKTNYVFPTPSFTSLCAKIKKSSNSKRSLHIDSSDDDNDNDENISEEAVLDDEMIELIDQIPGNLFNTKSTPSTNKRKTSSSSSTKSRSKSSNDDDTAKSGNSNPLVTPVWRETVESDIKSIIASTGDISILKLVIVQNRIELTVSNGAHENENIKQLSAEDLRSIHRQLYTAFELKEEELAVVTRFEVGIDKQYIHVCILCN